MRVMISKRTVTCQKITPSVSCISPRLCECNHYNLERRWGTQTDITRSCPTSQLCLLKWQIYSKDPIGKMTELCAFLQMLGGCFGYL